MKLPGSSLPASRSKCCSDFPRIPIPDRKSSKRWIRPVLTAHICEKRWNVYIYKQTMAVNEPNGKCVELVNCSLIDHIHTQCTQLKIRKNNVYVSYLARLLTALTAMRAYSSDTVTRMAAIISLSAPNWSAVKNMHANGVWVYGFEWWGKWKDSDKQEILHWLGNFQHYTR